MSIIKREKSDDRPLSAPSKIDDKCKENDDPLKGELAKKTKVNRLSLKAKSRVNPSTGENEKLCVTSRMAVNSGTKRNTSDSLKFRPYSQSEDEPSDGPTVVVTSDANSTDDASSLEDVPLCNSPLNAKIRSAFSVSSPDLSVFFDLSPEPRKQSQHDEDSLPVEDVCCESKTSSTPSHLSSISESDVPDWFAPSPALIKRNDSPDWFSPTPKRANSDSAPPKNNVSESFDVTTTKTVSDHRSHSTTSKKSNALGGKNSTCPNRKNEGSSFVEYSSGNLTPLRLVSNDGDGTVQRKPPLQRIEHHHHSHQHHHHHHYYYTSPQSRARSIHSAPTTPQITRNSSSVNRQQTLKNEIGAIIEIGDESNEAVVDVASSIVTQRSFKQPVVVSTSKSDMNDSISSGLRVAGDPGKRDDNVSRQSHGIEQVIPPFFRSKNFCRLGRKNNRKTARAKKKTTRGRSHKSRRKSSTKATAPVKVRKKKVAKKYQWFLDDEVAISQDSNVDHSSDEEEASRDSYESSFIDDLSQDNASKMAPIYLTSIRNPSAFERGGYDTSRTGLHIPKKDVVSQVSLGGRSEYELDSFCVGSDKSNMESVDEDSERDGENNHFEREDTNGVTRQDVHKSEAGQLRRPPRKRIVPLDVSSSE